MNMKQMLASHSLSGSMLFYTPSVFSITTMLEMDARGP